jgi:hypothetical protein
MIGITNATFQAKIEGDPQAIIYRRFGDSDESIFNINRFVLITFRRNPYLLLDVLKRRWT